jgi:hypothetical protein
MPKPCPPRGHVVGAVARRPPVALPVSLLGVVLLVVLVGPVSQPTAAEPGQHGRLLAAGAQWRPVLERLSRLRAAAWRSGSTDLLRRVYDPAAQVLRKDASSLNEYVERGLRVRGARSVFGRVKVQRREGGTVWLRVTDQLAHAVALSRSGRRIRLPYDQPSRHVIVLHRRAGQWRILVVRSWHVATTRNHE